MLASHVSGEKGKHCGWDNLRKEGSRSHVYRKDGGRRRGMYGYSKVTSRLIKTGIMISVEKRQ